MVARARPHQHTSTRLLGRGVQGERAHPGQRRAKEGGDQRNGGVSWVQLSTRVVSAVLRRAVTSLEMR